MSATCAAVLVMAKAPRPGMVKTRLEPMLGAEGCAALQASLLRHSVALAEATVPGRCYVAFDPPDARSVVAELISEAVELLAQPPGDLGERLATVTNEVFALGAGPLVVIGTDAPTLTPGDLWAAFDALADGREVALGPAYDGGYYLVGLSRPLPELFGLDPVLWGGGDVLAATLEAAHRARLDVGLLEPRRDLDTPADARALLDNPLLPDDVAQLLAEGER